jgi:hypothetical protein
MPRYYLHVHVGERHIEDPEGVEADNLDGAIKAVAVAANELLGEGLLDGKLTEQDHFEVTDAAGQTLAKVPLSDSFRWDG